MQWGLPLLVLAQAAHLRQPRPLFVAGPVQPTPITNTEPAQAPLAPGLLPSGTRVPVLGGRRVHT